VWATLPTHQVAHPQLWIHRVDGTLTVLPLEPHGRLAWPAAAALLRGDERSAELRDGATVLDSLFIHPTPATTTTAAITSTTERVSAPDAVLLSGNPGTGYFELHADTSVPGQLQFCITDLTGRACRLVERPNDGRLIALSDPHGRGITVVVAVAPPTLAGVAQLWVRTANGIVDTTPLEPITESGDIVAAQILQPHHGEVELRIGPTIVAILGADG